MIAETAKEVQLKAMMAAKAIAMEKLGNLMELGLGAFFETCQVCFLGPERRAERNQVMSTAMGETMKKMIPQVDKALKTLNLPIGDKFMFGDTISVVDLQVLTIVLDLKYHYYQTSNS